MSLFALTGCYRYMRLSLEVRMSLAFSGDTGTGRIRVGDIRVDEI